MVGGGWLWFVIDVIAVAILGAAMLYGVASWRNRNRSLDPLREESTRQLYREEDARTKELEKNR
jgi:hypothetical protein